MSESKEILVKDISELKPGVRIRIKPCTCGIHLVHKYFIHVPMKVRYQEMIDKGIPSQPGYQILPLPSCHKTKANRAICQYSIDENIVYRLIDLDDNFEKEESSKNKFLEEVSGRKLEKIE